MSEPVDFDHYLETGEIREVKPCQEEGHSLPHVSVLAAEGIGIARCNHCGIATIFKNPDDYFEFVKGQPVERCPRPFHIESKVTLIGDGYMCMGCSVRVEATKHPSFSGVRWRG